MKHALVSISITFVLLVACTSAQTATPASIATAAATATSPSTIVSPTIISASPTVAANTLTPTQSFEQWANTSTPDARLLQSAKTAYAKAMAIDISGIQIARQVVRGPNGDFAKIIDQNGVVLLISTTDAKGNTWQVATPASYWRAQRKFMGLYLNGILSRETNIQRIVSDHFSSGILALSGQVRPGPDIAERKPANATREFQLARQTGMALLFHSVAEPEKFPKEINNNNIDQWLRSRLSDIGDVILMNKSNQPVLVEFNEAWYGTNWSARNPIRDRYGENWLDEYIYQTMSVLFSKGLKPNTDFILMFNENEIYTNRAKQILVHDKLGAARIAAFTRLNSDFNLSSKLDQANIHKPEGIQIILGSETHTVIGPITDGRVFNFSDFYPTAPSAEQINSMADLFGDLGGIMMTEVNPNGGTKEQKKEFLRTITSVLAKNPNVRGIIFWNLFSFDPTDIYQTELLPLFSPDGTPTQLYYALLFSGN